MAARCSLGRVVRWRPTVELDAGVGRDAGAGAQQVFLLHAFALQLVARARVLHVT